MFVTRINEANVDYYLMVCIKEPMAHLEIKFPKKLDIGNIIMEVNMHPKHRKDSLEDEKKILSKMISIILEKVRERVFLNIETLEVVSKIEVIAMLKSLYKNGL